MASDNEKILLKTEFDGSAVESGVNELELVLKGLENVAEALQNIFSGLQILVITALDVETNACKPALPEQGLPASNNKALLSDNKVPAIEQNVTALKGIELSKSIEVFLENVRSLAVNAEHQFSVDNGLKDGNSPVDIMRHPIEKMHSIQGGSVETLEANISGKVNILTKFNQLFRQFSDILNPPVEALKEVFEASHIFEKYNSLRDSEGKELPLSRVAAPLFPEVRPQHALPQSVVNSASYTNTSTVGNTTSTTTISINKMDISGVKNGKDLAQDLKNLQTAHTQGVI